MYLYNITYNIDEETHDQWLAWMRTYHVPKILQSAPFYGAKLIEVMIDEEMGGKTYSIQYQAKSIQLLNSFLDETGMVLFDEMSQLFPNKFVSFSTKLQVLEEFEGSKF